MTGRYFVVGDIEADLLERGDHDRRAFDKIRRRPRASISKSGLR